MEKTARKTKKMARKSFLNTGKPAGQAEKKVPAVPTSYSTGWREEEELVDYELRTRRPFRLLITIFLSQKTVR
jgi:hypothetical protein